MNGSNQLVRFEKVVMPHLDAAYNLARWLMREEHDADDVVQESYLKAYQAFDSFRGDDGRAWLLTIVRNTSFTRIQQSNRHRGNEAFDDELHAPASEEFNPESMLMRRLDVERVRGAIEDLPLPLREVVVLRESEGMAYKQIADVVGIPIGTVMSRLSRARERLQQVLSLNSEGAVR